MAGLLADSPGGHSIRQGFFLLISMTVAAVVLTMAPSQPTAGAVAGPGVTSDPEGVATLVPEGPSAWSDGSEQPDDGFGQSTDGNRARIELVDSPETRLGLEAMAWISYPWRDTLPGWQIAFLPEQDGLYGLTKVSERRIEVYVRLDRDVEFVAHVIAHELGHAVDVTHNDGPDRRLWEEQRQLDSAPWWPENRATDFESGAGDFAESFAVWQVGPNHYRGRLAELPNEGDLALIAALAAG